MKKTSLWFRRIVSIFSLFLTLLPFSVKAGEMTSLFGYAAIFTRGGNSGGSTVILPERYATATNAQSANGWLIVTGKKVVLALPAASERPEALIDANDRECLENGSQPITSHGKMQTLMASGHLAAIEETPRSHL